MRMWMLEPSKMCTQHILGEHKELHMLVGSVFKGHSLWGYTNIIEPRSIYERHRQIVAEFKHRGWKSGYNHQSPISSNMFEMFILQLEELYPKSVINSRVDTTKSLHDITHRCDICRQNFGGVQCLQLNF